MFPLSGLISYKILSQRGSGVRERHILEFLVSHGDLSNGGGSRWLSVPIHLVAGAINSVNIFGFVGYT